MISQASHENPRVCGEYGGFKAEGHSQEAGAMPRPPKECSGDSHAPHRSGTSSAAVRQSWTWTMIALSAPALRIPQTFALTP